MGWEWKDDDNDDVSSKYGDVDVFDEDSNPRRISGDGDRCSTRKMVKSQCRTEEVEPGKFIRKCEKTESIFKDCLGRPSEVVQSNKEYTEEDVTEQVVKFSENGPFDFPGLRSDMEAIGRSFLGGIGPFFEAAEEMKKGLFNVFGDPHFYNGDSSSSSTQRDIPIEAHPPPREASPKSEGHVDLSGLAKDV